MHTTHGPERLRVYQLGLTLCRHIDTVIEVRQPHRSTADQLLRCAESIPFNIAEGSAFISPGRKVYHYNIARASVFELLAVLARLEHGCSGRDRELLARPRRLAHLIAKMLLALIQATRAREDRPSQPPNPD